MTDDDVRNETREEVAKGADPRSRSGSCWIEVSGEKLPKVSPLSESTAGRNGNVMVPAEPHLYEYQWAFQYGENPGLHAVFDKVKSFGHREVDTVADRE